ncbi:MAG TPA: hypothetical protein VEW48_08145 [Thermoanaerobaculia bacterium]|nr:hypothetical protein [Thermoanaerobaculia bacterium]
MDEDHEYFRAIEEIFLELRGSPLTLPPADWHVARRWHRAGIPVDVVRRALAEVFAKRKERGAKGKISRLSYCAPAVEAAWEELRELTAPGERLPAPAFDPFLRLQALAAALPPDLAGRDGLSVRILSLAGDPQEIEAGLAVLDREMLAAAAGSLEGSLRGEVEAAVEKTVSGLRGRLPADELERSRERLTWQVLRQRLALPVLSLFSPEAEVTPPP